MTEIENSKDLISVLWSGADILRSKMDANEYKDYLLGIVFYKYLSDSFLIKVYDLLYDEKPSTLKDAVEAYKEALKSCDCREWMRIINTVYKRKEERQAQGKKMSACDERYLKQAQDSLFGEFAISLRIEKNEVEDYMMQRTNLKEMASAS